MGSPHYSYKQWLLYTSKTSVIVIKLSISWICLFSPCIASPLSILYVAFDKHIHVAAINTKVMATRLTVSRSIAEQWEMEGSRQWRQRHVRSSGFDDAIMRAGWHPDRSASLAWRRVYTWSSNQAATASRRKKERILSKISLNCYRQTRATLIVLYTARKKVDAQCDKLATVVGGTNNTCYCRYVLWRNFCKSKFGTKFQKEVGLPLFSEIPNFT